MSDTEDEWDDETTLLFRTIMQQADEHNLDIEAQSAAFVKNYGSDFTKRNGREDSILHYMAKRPMQENSGQHRLLKFLLEKHNGSDLLKPNDDNQTPLHLGLKRGISNRTNPVFVDTVLALVPSHTLQNVLQECDSSMRSNCLHYAIKNQSPSAMSLIPRCPASLFTQQNVKGETPLHLAMELTIRQNRVPQRVADSNPIPRMEQDAGKWRVEGDDSILPAKDGLTTKFSEVQRQGGMQPPSPHGKNLQNHKNSAQFIANSARNMHLSKNTAVGPGSVASVATPKPTPSQTHPNSFYLPDVVESLLQDPLVARDTLILKTYAHPNQQGGTVGPYQSRINHVTKQALKSQQSKQQSGDSQSVRKAVEQDPIVRFIKDYCLRNLEREDVIRILYEKDEGRHIEFDLSGLPDPAMPASYLEQLSKHLRFEDCLQYVALPELRMQQRDVYINTLSPEKDQSTLAVLQSQCTGLTDAVVIFDWLRKRDVKKIIRVIVMDSGEVPHTDEAIVESLKDFEVEVWDWRKFDICSETIQLAAKDVRVLHLYSSGINAVLRGWSSEVGLVLLGKLERVKLVSRQGFESAQKRDLDIEQFKKALRRNWVKLYGIDRKAPVIEVEKDDSPKSIARVLRNTAVGGQKPGWFQYMDSFADYLVCINERVKDEIKVAVIDDGINGFDKRIADRIDSGGHGTTMSSLICRVFPKAKLLIARLDEYRQPETGKRVITARSATEAIRWAISKGAHVISMSWTIDSRGNDHDIQELRKIIKEAQTDHGTIMFCAFSDQGNVHAENCVPASCPETITIGAATSWASPCTWVDSDSVDYLFPGEHVLIDRNAKPGTQSKSGSSIATALAAGLAALLLHITQLAKPAYYPAIRSKEGIKAAFEKMAAKNKYVHVRSHFHLDFQENAFWQWEAQGREKLATLVSNLVVDPEVGLFA